MNRVDNVSELIRNKIFLFENFLTEDECNSILFRIDNKIWVKSTIAFLDENKVIKSSICNTRTSQTCFESDFSYSLSLLVNQVQNRLASKLNIDIKKIESWQITKYQYQNKFKMHHDCGLWENHLGGEREKTIMIYLMPPVEGGGTYFRALNLSVRPLQGRLVVWDNLLPNGNCNHAMIHSGEPIVRGIKVILHTWVRQYPLSKG